MDGHWHAVATQGLARFADSDLVRLALGRGFYRAVLTESSFGSEPELDFTFPTAGLIEGLGKIQGMTLEGATGDAILLTETPELIRSSGEGELLDRRTFDRPIRRGRDGVWRMFPKL